MTDMAQKYVLGPNAARELSKMLHGSGGEVSRRPTLAPSLAFDSEYVAPFTVQWSASSAEGEGSWIIWLPDASIVSVDGTTVDPTTDLDDVGGDYPEGWYLLDGETLDPDEGGKLYLNISTGDTPECEFSASAGSGDDTVTVVVCETAVDSESGARSVKQFVSSAVVIASGSGSGETVYNADERSISNLREPATEASEIDHTHFFYINGFGKFTTGAYSSPIGGYTAPATAELELDGSETDFAVIGRTGNSSSADSNYITYKRLKLKSQAGSSPFKYEKTTTTSGGSTVTTHKLVNCCFYWQGEMKTLADYDVSGIIDNGSVYLCGKQDAPSPSDPDPEWEWSIVTSAGTEPTGGKVLNYKLYDFAQSKPSVDYRTTFLALEDHTTKAKIVVEKPDGDASITLDASGDNAVLTITNGDGKTVEIDTDDIPSECDGALGIHELTYVDEEGDEQVYHGVFCEDIDLPDVDQREIVAGSGISVAKTGSQIVISNTRGSGGSSSSSTTGFTGEKRVVTEVSYDESTHTLDMQYETWKFTNGLLKEVTVDQSLTTITTAVEETA